MPHCPGYYLEIIEKQNKIQNLKEGDHSVNCNNIYTITLLWRPLKHSKFIFAICKCNKVPRSTYFMKQVGITTTKKLDNFNVEISKLTTIQYTQIKWKNQSCPCCYTQLYSV